MFKTLRNAFQVADIRKRIAYTFMMLVVVRLGSLLPAPGVDASVLSSYFSGQYSAFNFLNVFTGGSLEQMSIFALSISPYITSSIIVQLLTIAIPKLEEMQKDGEDGKKKMAAITRYVTVALAVIQSVAMGIGFGNQGLFGGEKATFMQVALFALTLTAGSSFLMWAGERITEKGLGNGISMILLINILSSLPQDLVNLYANFIDPQIADKKYVIAALIAILILVIILVVVVFVIFLQGGQRKIPVQYSQKIQGRKTVGGQSSHIPLKVNTAGVIPVIFASSLMQFPILIGQFLNTENKVATEILKGLNSGYWFAKGGDFKYTWGLLVYMVLTVAFAYFYTSITFNPLEIANNMKKSGGFVPGIRPGKPTADYLSKILNYIIFVGAAGLIIVQVIPFFFAGRFGAQVSFGGTSLIIIVGVVLETIEQVESKMVVRNYKGFLNSGK